MAVGAEELRPVGIGDVLGVRLGSDVVGAVAQLAAVADVARITSYNVCYTKLLRSSR